MSEESWLPHWLCFTQGGTALVIHTASKKMARSWKNSSGHRWGWETAGFGSSVDGGRAVLPHWGGNAAHPAPLVILADQQHASA